MYSFLSENDNIIYIKPPNELALIPKTVDLCEDGVTYVDKDNHLEDRKFQIIVKPSTLRTPVQSPTR